MSIYNTIQSSIDGHSYEEPAAVTVKSQPPFRKKHWTNRLAHHQSMLLGNWLTCSRSLLSDAYSNTLSSATIAIYPDVGALLRFLDALQPQDHALEEQTGCW